jgi:hypothetical protein
MPGQLPKFVNHPDGERLQRLVNATSAAQAIRHVMNNRYTAKVAGQMELVDLVASGVEVESVE